MEEALKKALASPSESTTLITPGNLGSAAYGTSTSTSTTAAATPAQLSALSDMLVSGDKRDALEYASGHGLWSHALVIASSLGPELWKETLNRFIQAELAGEGVAGLRASYSLFAGADPSIGMSSHVLQANIQLRTSLALRVSRTTRARINGEKSSLRWSSMDGRETLLVWMIWRDDSCSVDCSMSLMLGESPLS